MFISPVAIAFILFFYLVTQAQQELTYLVWDPNSVSTHNITLCIPTYSAVYVILLQNTQNGMLSIFW